MSNLAFHTAARRAEPVVFTIDAEEFKFTPPKLAVVALARFIDGADINQAQWDWFMGGLDEAGRTRIVEKLNDPGDGLEFPLIWEIVLGLVETVTGRPTDGP